MIIYLVERLDQESSIIVSAYYNEDDAIQEVKILTAKDEASEQKNNEWVMNGCDEDENEEDDNSPFDFGYIYTHYSIEVK